MSGLGITFLEPWLSPIRRAYTEETSQDHSPSSNKDHLDSDSNRSANNVQKQSEEKYQPKEINEDIPDPKKEEKALVLLDKLLNSMLENKKLDPKHYSEQNALIICSILEKVKDVLDSGDSESDRENQKHDGGESKQVIKKQINHLMRLMQQGCISTAQQKKSEQESAIQITELSKSLTDYLPPTSPASENQNYNKVLFIEKSELNRSANQTNKSQAPPVIPSLVDSVQKNRISSLQSVKQHLQPKVTAPKNEKFQPFHTQSYYSEHEKSNKEAQFSLEGLYFRTYSNQNDTVMRSVTPQPSVRTRKNEEVRYSTPNSNPRRYNFESCTAPRDRGTSLPVFNQKALPKSASKLDTICKRNSNCQKVPKSARAVIASVDGSRPKKRIITTIAIPRQKEALCQETYNKQNKVLVSSPLKAVSNQNSYALKQNNRKKLTDHQQNDDKSYTEFSENSTNITKEFRLVPKYSTAEKPKRYAEICSNKNNQRTTPKKPYPVSKYSEIHKSYR